MIKRFNGFSYDVLFTYYKVKQYTLLRALLRALALIRTNNGHFASLDDEYPLMSTSDCTTYVCLIYITIINMLKVTQVTS